MLKFSSPQHRECNSAVESRQIIVCLMPTVSRMIFSCNPATPLFIFLVFQMKLFLANLGAHDPHLQLNLSACNLQLTSLFRIFYCSHSDGAKLQYIQQHRMIDSHDTISHISAATLFHNTRLDTLCSLFPTIYNRQRKKIKMAKQRKERFEK